MNNKRISLYGIIIAIYVGLTILLGTFSFWIVQIRISEVMLLLCLKKKEYALPLTIACFLANIIGQLLGLDIWPLDFIFGSLATFISCLMIYKFRNIRLFNRPILSLVSPAVINGLIIGLEAALFTSEQISFINTFGTTSLYVALGELISCTLLGLLVYKPLDKAYSEFKIDV